MAKRKRTSARRAYTHAHLPASKRYSYTPELLADGRRRYEQTDEPIVDIAADFRCHQTTFQRMANREGWVRYQAPPRDLSPAAKLAAQAEELQQPAASAQIGTGGALPPAGSTAARLHAAVLNELTAVEAMRAAMKSEPQKPADADITARTLARLTDTLAKLQRLQAAAPSPASGPAYDDMPADLDEFRHALARRIEAFFASRPDAGDDAAADAGGAATA